MTIYDFTVSGLSIGYSRSFNREDVLPINIDPPEEIQEIITTTYSGVAILPSGSFTDNFISSEDMIFEYISVGPEPEKPTIAQMIHEICNFKMSPDRLEYLLEQIQQAKAGIKKSDEELERERKAKEEDLSQYYLLEEYDDNDSKD
jgi:hypothetical protein